MHPEYPIFAGTDRHIGKAPYYSLSTHSNPNYTYKGNVRPLNGSELEQTTRALASQWKTRGESFGERVRRNNRTDFGSSERVVIVLDGRYKGHSEGYLGDMVEATRLVRPLQARLKEVIIATPHPDIFEGKPDSNVSILPIPEEIGGVPKPPWDIGLREFLYDQVGETPCILPMNANNINYAILGPDGQIKNEETFVMTRDVIRTGWEGLDIDPQNWWRKGIHQLQALQTMYYLLGGDDAKEWSQFPDAYLYPSASATSVAKEVVELYGCFSTPTRVCPPIYLHIGVATNGRKLLAKYYPEDKWSQVLQTLARNPEAPNSVTFLEPSDPEQAATTLRLATTAVDNGLHVAKVPMSQLRSQWTLGSFIAFLQELSLHKGMIVGCDSMPAGHAGPAVGNPSVVLGSPAYNPGFYCPAERTLVVMPSENYYTSGIRPNHVAQAVIDLCHEIN